MQSKKELFQNLKKDCRSSLRKTNSLNLSTNPDLESFHEFWVKNTPWQRWVPSVRNFRKLKKSFGSSSLLLASHNMEAGAIFLLANQKAYYWQAFTGKAGRTSLAQYQILWQGIFLGSPPLGEILRPHHTFLCWVSWRVSRVNTFRFQL